jgi:hypothetical protein
MTSELVRLQHWIVEQLQSQRGLSRSEPVTQEAARHLTGNARLRPVDQLEIYREQFWLRHTTSLVEDFPGVGGILGQERWQGLVQTYLARHGPAGWTLRDLGRHFPEHIAQASDLPQRALCHDMARLEWQFIELFDAPETPPLALSSLAALPPGAIERATFDLSPALSLLTVDYPVADLRIQLLDATRTESVPIPDIQHQRLVLYRGAHLRLFHHPLSEEAFVLLEELQRGLCLLAACERALERLPDAGERLQAGVGDWFQDWVRRGWIVRVRAEAERP